MNSHDEQRTIRKAAADSPRGDDPHCVEDSKQNVLTIIEDLHELAMMHRKQLQALADRLGPVLNPETSTDTDRPAVRHVRSRSPLAMKIAEILADLDGTHRSLGDLIRRLEV